MSGNFEALLAELNTEVESMAKALPAADDLPPGDEDEDLDKEGTVDTAATDKKVMAAAGDGDADDEGGKPDGDADDAPMMGKSMTVEIDGKQVEAFDGTELVKSLMGQVEQLGGKLTASEDKLAKALTETLGVVKSQGAVIKSLQDTVAKLATAGRGRKSAVVVHGFCDRAMFVGFVLGIHFRGAGEDAACGVRGDTPRDNEARFAARAFGIKSREAVKAAVGFFERGVHRPHERTVAQGYEAEI